MNKRIRICTVDIPYCSIKEIEKLFVLLAIFFKQFYILPSGSFQIGEFFLMSAFALFFFEKVKNLKIEKDEIYLLLFILSTWIINYTHYGIDGTSLYLRSSLYLSFNYMTVLVFSYLVKEDLQFICRIRMVAALCLLIQLLLLITGKGRWYDISRYMGTFNDPNQYGIYVYLCVALIIITSYIIHKRSWNWYCIGCVLMMFSASTGVLLAFFLTGFLSVVFVFSKYCRRKEFVLAFAIIFILLLCLVLLYLLDIWNLPDIVLDKIMGTSMYNRVVHKVSGGSGGIFQAVSDRQWDRLVKYPQYILFGAGEGNYQRFNSDLEIHSSFLGPLFYYGILPWLIMISWFIRKMKKAGWELCKVYIAVLVEAMTLINYRQPMFWMIFVLANCVEREKIFWRFRYWRSGVKNHS